MSKKRESIPETEKKYQTMHQRLVQKKLQTSRNMFKNIHKNYIRYNVDNFVDYFNKANVDITNEGEDFKKLMENIGISQNSKTF